MMRSSTIAHGGSSFDSWCRASAPFAAVATSVENGAEVWLRKGSTLNAVRASLAMPGLFTPVSTDDGILVDGALVNPVPVSLARAMGAEIVIAVDLSHGIVGRNLVVRDADASEAEENGWLRRSIGRLWPTSDEPPPPSMLGVIAASLDIMQVRITRSRMAGEPPDVTVAPRLAHIGVEPVSMRISRPKPAPCWPPSCGRRSFVPSMCRGRG